MQLKSAFCVFLLGVLAAMSSPVCPQPQRPDNRIGLVHPASGKPSAEVSPRRVFLDVPHIRQERELCVPTSAAMVLAYFGDPRSPRELKTLAAGRAYEPEAPFTDYTMTWFKDMVSGMRRLGYEWEQDSFMNNSLGFANGLAKIKARLRRSEPALVDTSLWTGHTFVVVGYDDETSMLDVVDPNLSPPGRRLLGYDEFEKIWNSLPVGFNGRGAIFTSRKR